MEERSVLRLSDLYRPRTEHPYLELETLVLNINKGYNAELMEKCRELHDYSVFVALVREKRKSGMNLKHAVNEAIDECIHQDIMADFLRKNRAEVVKMSIYEYDEEKNYRMLQEQSWERGREKGREEEIISLILKNLKKGCSSAQIADFLDLDKIVVETVCRLASETAPDYDLEKIYESYWQLTHYDNSIVIKS